MAALYNREIERINTVALTAIYEGRGSDAQAVIDAIKGTTGTVTAYIEKRIEQTQASGQYWERKKQSNLLRKMHNALGGGPVGWDQLTPQALRRIEAHLRDVVKNGPNTVRKEMKRLRTVANAAVKDGVIPPDKDPFVRYSLPKSAPVTRRRLSIEEVRLLAAVELEDGSMLSTVRDAWMFAFLCGGLRISDLLRLTGRHIQDDRLRYRMQKTGAVMDLPLAPAALALVKPHLKRLRERMLQPPSAWPNPYVFPIMKPGADADPGDIRRRQHVATAKYNTLIKQAAERAGLDPAEISSHTARHSFTNCSRREDLFAVSKTLAHSTIAQTQAYLASFDTDATDRVIRSIDEAVSL